METLVLLIGFIYIGIFGYWAAGEVASAWAADAFGPSGGPGRRRPGGRKPRRRAARQRPPGAA